MERCVFVQSGVSFESDSRDMPAAISVKLVSLAEVSAIAQVAENDVANKITRKFFWKFFKINLHARAGISLVLRVLRGGTA